MLASVSLKSHAADRLQTLIRLNRESAKCFRSAGDRIDDAELTALFYRFARQRQEFADELARFPAARDDGGASSTGEATTRALTTMHRWWHALRQRLAIDEVDLVLRLASRAEEEIRETYEDLLRHPLDPDLTETLQRQHAAVAEAEQRLHALHQARAMRPAG